MRRRIPRIRHGLPLISSSTSSRPSPWLLHPPHQSSLPVKPLSSFSSLAKATPELAGPTYSSRRLPTASSSFSIQHSRSPFSTSASTSASSSGRDGRLESPVSSSTLFKPDSKPFYITTPIFYVNACHLHSLVLSDSLARFSALRNPDRPVEFMTGTDEHGLKVQQAAAGKGVEPRVFCDEISERFRNLAKAAGIGNTDFIRTTEERHYAAVAKFWDRLVASGDVYKGTHEGWYSVSDECFYAPSQVAERDGKMVALESGNEVVWESEENWKFRLSSYRQGLEDWLQAPESVQPERYRLDILRQASEMKDLSISRPASRVKWGVPVPGDPSQTIYVWVDALVNYITVAGYPGEMKAWPADVHVVGKDIIRFHALHWPALLLSAGLLLPRRVLAHAHWTMNRSKMSKSRGNVVDPFSAISTYGPGGIRWFLLRHGGSLPDDADYSEGAVERAYGELKDQVGNLVGRIGSGSIVAKLGAGEVREVRDTRLEEELRKVREVVGARMEQYDVTRACEAIMNVVVLANKHFTAAAPWTATVTNSTLPVTYAYHALRIAGILLQPIMPTKAGELLDRLGVGEGERRWEDASWDGTVDGEEIGMRIKKGTEGGVRKVEGEVAEGSSVGKRGKKVKGAPPLFPPIEVGE